MQDGTSCQQYSSTWSSTHRAKPNGVLLVKFVILRVSEIGESLDLITNTEYFYVIIAIAIFIKSEHGRVFWSNA
jgi:hypothetical protein